MTTLHQFEHLRLAQALSDYLTGLGINNIIQENEFYYEILLTQGSQFAQAQQELNEFLANPNQNKYLAASWQTGHVKQDSPQLKYEAASLIINLKNQGGVVTHCIFAICLLIYALLELGFFKQITSALSFFTHQPFNGLQSWRFITPAFLHFSVLHIVFNLMWWSQLGGLIELQQGKQRLIILFLFSAIASNLAQFFLVGPAFGGLSGVVYGLVGYCWLYGTLHKNSKVKLNNSMFLFLLGWLVLGFVDVLPFNIANYAHLIGLFAGLITAAICSKLKL